MSLLHYRFRARSVGLLLGLLLATCGLLFLSAAALAFTSSGGAAVLSLPSLPLALGASPRLPTQQAALAASDAATYNEFGMSVALDGNTAVVGDPYETSGSYDHGGVVYVYTWSGTSWTQQ
jgi:hypothetical protein